jgi:hypothetical protein
MVATVSPFVSNDQFRADFPAFKDIEKYQNASVTMYLTLAGNMLPANRWYDMWTIGQELFAAHFLVLDAQDEGAVSKGRNTPAGPITSKAVGAVNVSYDATSAMEVNAGQWNMTSYGRRFIRFARMAGAGADQINGAQPFPGNWFPGNALPYETF